MKKNCEQLLDKHERELKNFLEMQPPKRMRSELDAVRGSLAKLWEMVQELGFASQANEMNFLRWSSQGSIRQW